MRQINGEVHKILTRGLEIAKKNNQALMGLHELFIALLESTDKELLDTYALHHNKNLHVELKKRCSNLVNTEAESIEVNDDLKKEIKDLLENANEEAGVLDAQLIKPIHLFFAYLQTNDPTLSKIFNDLNLTYEHITTEHFDNLIDGSFTQKPNYIDNSVNDTSFSYIATFCKPLSLKTKFYKKDPVKYRDNEINFVIETLSNRNKCNPLIIGEAGVGKTALIEGIQYRIDRGQVPINLRGMQIVELNVANLVAGTKFRGEFEDRLNHILAEVKLATNIILYIDEFHITIGAGSTGGALDLSNIIKPEITNGNIKIIGATTLDEYKKNISQDKALVRRFSPITLDELTKEQTLDILVHVRPTYEKFHGVKYPKKILNTIINLSDQYLNGKYPDKAITVLDEVGSHVKSKELTPPHLTALLKKIETQKVYQITNVKKYDPQKEKILIEKYQQLENEYFDNKVVEKVLDTDVYNVIAKKTNLDVEHISKKYVDRLTSIEQNIKTKIVGQNNIIEPLISTLMINKRLDLDKEKPFGSFLFCGTSGVGKTEVAKIISKELFDENSLVYINLTEFTEKHTISRLIGSPSGYVGYKEPSMFDRIKAKPNCVLLLDEIEKAHPVIFSLFMKILEEGEIEDSMGTIINFRNTIIIMTANIVPKSGIGFTENSHMELESMLRKHFKSEFLNRIDEILLFNTLGEKEIRQLLNIELQKLKNKKVNINKISQSMIDDVVAMSIDTKYGARLLYRNIRRYIYKPLFAKR